MLRTECELDEKVPPSPPETLVQGLGPLDSPLSIGFEAHCMSHVAMACPTCLHALMIHDDCTPHINVLGQEGALEEPEKNCLKKRETSICGYEMMIP